MSFRIHNLKVRLIRLARETILFTRVIRMDRPWARIDAWAYGLVEIKGRYYDLAFEMPFDTPRDWMRMWGEFMRDFARGDLSAWSKGNHPS